MEPVSARVEEQREEEEKEGGLPLPLAASETRISSFSPVGVFCSASWLDR